VKAVAADTAFHPPLENPQPIAAREGFRAPPRDPERAPYVFAATAIDIDSASNCRGTDRPAV